MFQWSKHTPYWLIQTALSCTGPNPNPSMFDNQHNSPPLTQNGTECWIGKISPTRAGHQSKQTTCTFKIHSISTEYAKIAQNVAINKLTTETNTPRTPNLYSIHSTTARKTAPTSFSWLAARRRLTCTLEQHNTQPPSYNDTLRQHSALPENSEPDQLGGSPVACCYLEGVLILKVNNNK